MNELDHRADGNTMDAMASALTAAAASFATLSRAGKPLRLRFAAPETPSGSFALTVTLLREGDGYHLRAEPEACLDAGAEQRERLAVLDGMVIEARGRDAETAVDLLLEHVEHYLRPLVAWVVAGA
jgi:hypothetical protein